MRVHCGRIIGFPRRHYAEMMAGQRRDFARGTVGIRMKCRSRAGRLMSATSLVALLAIGAGISGCRTTDDDIHRWANTACV